VRYAAAFYQAAGRRQVLRVYRAWAEKWRRQRPRAEACLERDLEELLNFYSVPPAHWRKVRTTDIIERRFREARRRTRPMSSFTNLASCDRIIFGVLSYLNRAWEKTPLKQFTQLR
jgi:transposase-like protein